MSFAYLRQISENFLDALTALPELELSREQTEVDLSADAAEALLESVPYCIGSEYIDEHWLRQIFKQLNSIFSYEITEYEGSVSMFLAEKSQKIRVPERVFFHLVESEEEKPFAFLATYATKDEEDRIKHMPLQYALTPSFVFYGTGSIYIS